MDRKLLVRERAELSCGRLHLLPPVCVRSVGVPQGSILGPLLYCIFTNDFPEVVQDEDCNRGDTETLPGYSSHCQKCGGVTIYADDSTYTVSDKDQEKLSEKISGKFKSMADYLTANKLKVNSDKTHLLLMTTEQKRRYHPTTVTIKTDNEIIETTEAERLLGAYIHQDMKWTEYIRNNDNSLLHCLNKRLGALKMISKSASFKARLLVANGIFMSKLIFMIPLWAGCQGFIIDALQVCQNKEVWILQSHSY